MRELSRFHKVLFFFNLLVVALLLVACVVPHVTFSSLTFLGLSVPALVLTNLLFLAYWGFKRKKKQAYPSLFILVFGYFALGTFYKLKLSEEPILKEDLSVMSYNVRVFNRNGDIDSNTIFEDIKTFIEKEDPDIICLQEPDYKRLNEFENYPYKCLKNLRVKGKGPIAILSKYPIVNEGLINFPDTRSSAVFADILYQNDTIRVYNTHLESLGITPGKRTLRNEPSGKLFKMLKRAFKKQQKQAKILRDHRSLVNYRTLLCGDFNNSQFSNVYKIIKGDLQDTFMEQGTGYGRTLNFHRVPVRIDFIMADKTFEVKSHKSYNVKYSDHYPIMASFELK